ncbi:MAG: hypothetical protein ACOXZQ_10005 [Bacteroidales bacterium]|jgi:hypothetical protein
MGREGDRTLFNVFVFAGGALCLFFAIIFRPITFEGQGDYPAYLDLARQIFHLPGATENDLSHRSPLYSLLMGLFILLFGEAHYTVPLVLFQYGLVFLSSLLVYRIVLMLIGRDTAAFIAAFAGIVNLATIFFGYMILSETLALFLFTLLVWLLFYYVNGAGRMVIITAGLVTGLLILARFNMLGLPVVILVLLTIFFIFGKPRCGIRKIAVDLSLFVIGLCFVLNGWAFRNYLEYGRYELLPRHHLGVRWAIPATISPSDTVSSEYQPVLDIFLQTRGELIEKERSRVNRQSSLLENDFVRKVNDSFRPSVSGYLMYRDSEEELLRHYELAKNQEGLRLLNEKLKPFYGQIAAQHKSEISRFRIYSLLYTFKHISPTIAGEERLNLNKVPSPLLKAYKMLFIAVALFVYLASLLHTIYMLMRRKRIRAGLQWLMIYGLIWYFPVVNWYANVLGDANRFRYPADMLLAGLFVSYLYIAAALRGAGGIKRIMNKPLTV